MLNQTDDDHGHIPESSNESAIPFAVGANVRQQQSQRNNQSTRPLSSAERQRRYREKKKANKMVTGTEVEVDPVEHARKQHLNRLRQRRFREKHAESDDPATYARKQYYNQLRYRKLKAKQKLESPGTSLCQEQPERKRNKLLQESKKLLEESYTSPILVHNRSINQSEEMVASDEKYSNLQKLLQHLKYQLQEKTMGFDEQLSALQMNLYRAQRALINSMNEIESVQKQRESTQSILTNVNSLQESIMNDYKRVKDSETGTESQSDRQTTPHFQLINKMFTDLSCLILNSNN